MIVDKKSLVYSYKQDKKLVSQLLAGSEEAYQAFEEEYFPKVYRYALARLRDKDEVDDVLQETMIAAARYMHTYRGEAALLTWLIQICRNQISKNVNKRKKDIIRSSMDDTLLQAVIESMPIPESDMPENEALRKQLAGIIRLTLDRLPKRYSHALELKYIEGHSSKYLAEKFDLSDEAMQSLLARARRAFREICDESLRAFIGLTEESQLNE